MTATCRLSKHHGLGNDFLVALASRNEDLVPDPDLARQWCDRHRGIGADGLLWFLPSERAGVDGRLVLHNSDGTEAQISGNGVRCLAQAVVLDRGLAEAVVVIDTAAGDRTITVTAAADSGVSWAEVDMGAVHDGPLLGDPALLGVPGIRQAATGDVGNPHLVIWADGAWALDPAIHGQRIEGAFPDGINVHFIEPADNGAVRMRIWERGAGVTGACGSGATVVAHLARRWGLVDHDLVAVEMPGGVASMRIGSDSITLGSTVVRIADIEIPGVRS